MQKVIWYLKKNYRELRKAIEIKRGISKPDSVADVVIYRNADKPVVWLLGTEDFGNLGDHKIAIAIRHFLNRYFSDFDVVEVSARNYFAHCEEIEQNILSEDIIMGTGGGNFGNQYPMSQEIRKDYVQRFPNNKLVVMPQTIWYTADEAGQKALEEDVKLFEQHKHLLIAAREEKSFHFAQQYFHNKVLLVPDMVLSEKPFEGSVQEKNPQKVVLCLRSDLEGILDKDKHKQIIRQLKKEFQVLKKTDTQKDYLISTEKRDEEMLEMLAEMTSASLVVTDRLHGMVFAALAQTPCIVFDNYNSKVKGIYEWMKELPYIRYKGTDIEIEQDIKELTIMREQCVFAISGMEEHFAQFAEVIRTF